MMVGLRPRRCQWTARQLASVLLPLPPFIVATVIIGLVTCRPPDKSIATNQRVIIAKFASWQALTDFAG